MSYDLAPVDHHDEREHRRQLAEVANSLRDGKINATGTFTLTANDTTTAITDARIGAGSVILWVPLTANAAADLTGMYVSARGNGTATITHPNDADTDKDFSYAVFG